jgi:peptidoglycan/LPS O-acetylase OafA/YrhL
VDGKRLDIQGLRAIAVMLVIANHLFGWPSGGFIGVDVFFVISGFLISGHLLREHERTKRISLADFYRRRIRRIVPAAATVLVVTTTASFALFSTGRATSVCLDALWAVLFGANWHFAAVGTDYMQASGPISPIQHFWSLSVEEQFYLLWPLIMIALLGGAWTKLRADHRALTIVVSALSILSFAWAIWETLVNPTWAYFSTFSRAWELGLGAIAAITADRISRIPAAVRPALAWTGLAGIAASALFLNDTSAFPGPWAAVPVIGTALVIAAGTGREQRHSWLLRNPVTSYLGDISYSLYLWHFPVFVFAAALLAGTPRRQILVEVPLILALSVLSYHFVENPIRRSKRLGRSSSRLTGLAMVVTTLIIGITGLVIEQSAQATQAAEALPHPWTSVTDLQTGARAALSAPVWPTLSPSIDTIGMLNKAPQWVKDGCLGDELHAIPNPIKNAARCIYGDKTATKTAVIYGDSVAISWAPAIIKALAPEGYRVEIYANQQCPTSAVAVHYGDGAPMKDCDQFRNWAIETIRTTHPDLVIISNSVGTLTRLNSGARGTAAASEWATGTQSTLEKISSSASRVVVLSAPPQSAGGFAKCAGRFSHPSDCVTAVTPLDREMRQIDAQVAKRFDNVNAISTSMWFCVDDQRCPSFIGHTPILADGSHLTRNFSEELAPLMKATLLG